MTRVGIFPRTDDLVDFSHALAQQLGLPLAASVQDHAFDYVLVLTKDYLGIQKTGEQKFSPFYIDFLSGKMAYRGQQANRRNELLARAMGVGPQENPVIIDATAGLGRDSFILAVLGYQVIMLERSPVLYALLTDALRRAQQDPASADTVSRLRLIQADAIEWLPLLPAGQQPDIIYLDPMFPARKKSASVKKEMVMTQALLGKDEDVDALFQAAFHCAKRRVVVKRPRLAANINERAPAFSLAGKSSRFDIYLV